MATLENTAIQDTYEGLLKITDNAALTTANKIVSDGAGTATGIKVGSGTTVEFTKKISQTGLGFSTFFGEDAGLNDDGSNNKNTAFGYLAMRDQTSNSESTAVGYNTLRSATGGGSHVAVGSDSQRETVSTYGNTSVGSRSLRDNTTGGYSSALGYRALQTQTSGIFNVAFGYDSLAANTTGGLNTAIGSEAGDGTNYNRGVYVGYNAGKNHTQGDDKLFIANTNTATPLIFGDFSTPEVTINGDLKARNGDIDNTGGYKDSTGALGTAGQVLSSTGAVTTWINASGGGGSTIRQTMPLWASATPIGTWSNWTQSRDMATQTPSFNSGTGAEPGLLGANNNRFFLKTKGKLTSLHFSGSKEQNGATIEVFACSFDYADDRYTLANKQVLISETFTTTANESFAKTNFTIATHTLADESILMIGLRSTVNQAMVSFPVLTWGFES